MKFDPSILANIMAILTNHYVTCQYNEEEDVYIFRVFMVNEIMKKTLKREIKEYLEKFHDEGWDLFYSVLMFDVNQTNEYYPDVAHKITSSSSDIISSCINNNQQDTDDEKAA